MLQVGRDLTMVRTRPKISSSSSNMLRYSPMLSTRLVEEDQFGESGAVFIEVCVGADS